MKLLVVNMNFWNCRFLLKGPTEEFELSADSLGAHVLTHSEPILRTLSYLTVNSQDDSHCEIAVRWTF